VLLLVTTGACEHGALCEECAPDKQTDGAHNGSCLLFMSIEVRLLITTTGIPPPCFCGSVNRCVVFEDGRRERGGEREGENIASGDVSKS